MSKNDNSKSGTYYMNADEVSSAKGQYDASLSTMSDNNKSTQSIIDNFLASSAGTLSGVAWDSVKDNIQTYEDCLKYLDEVGQIIEAANDERTKAIQEFLGEDKELNTDDLPKFEAEKANLESQIAALEAENAELAKVQPEPIYDDEGNVIGYDDSNVRAAQEKIAENNKRIQQVLQPALNECIRLINKINEFNNVLLPALDKKMDDLMSKVQEGLNKVSDLRISILEKKMLNGELPGTPFDYNDTEARDARVVEIYDLLIDRGFSDLGARAIISNMNAESHLIAHRYQGDDPVHYPGYGLCQWERVLGGSIGCGTAYKLINWCDANGYDFMTAEGQIAYLDYDLKTRLPDLYAELRAPSSFTADDYINSTPCRDALSALTGKFGVQYEAGGNSQKWESSRSRAYVALNANLFDAIANRPEGAAKTTSGTTQSGNQAGPSQHSKSSHSSTPTNKTDGSSTTGTPKTPDGTTNNTAPPASTPSSGGGGGGGGEGGNPYARAGVKKETKTDNTTDEMVKTEESTQPVNDTVEAAPVQQQTYSGYSTEPAPAPKKEEEVKIESQENIISDDLDSPFVDQVPFEDTPTIADVIANASNEAVDTSNAGKKILAAAGITAALAGTAGAATYAGKKTKDKDKDKEDKE